MNIYVELIQNVIQKCSDISNYELVEITRSQAPWRYNYRKGEKIRFLIML